MPLRIVAHCDEEHAAKMGDGGCPGQRSNIWTADTGRLSPGEPMQKVTGT
jgi:hypothetical protein